jgi:hypothetical protein
MTIRVHDVEQSVVAKITRALCPNSERAHIIASALYQFHPLLLAFTLTFRRTIVDRIGTVTHLNFLN